MKTEDNLENELKKKKKKKYQGNKNLHNKQK